MNKKEKLLQSLNLNLLVYFKILLTERHISKAAKTAGLSQPGMSHVLKQLREILGDPILVPGKGGLVPTQNAKAILAQLEPALQTIEACISKSETFDPRSAKRQFSIIATDYIGLTLLPKLAKKIHENFPDITLDIWPWNATSDPKLAEKVDLILGFYTEEAPRGFHETTLFEEHYVCMFRKNHPRIKDKLTLKQFMNETHMIVREQDGAIGVVNAALEKINLVSERKVGLQVPHFLMFPFIVATTDMIITTTSRNAHAFEHKLPIRTLPLPIRIPKVPIKMLWHARHNQSPPHLWLRTLVKEIAKTV